MFNGKEVTLAIPVYNNYAGLRDMLFSIEAGTVVPDMYCILNNGKSDLDLSGLDKNKFVLMSTGGNNGVTKSWNLFISSIKEIRIILNDDLLFHKDTLEKFLAGMAPDTLCSPSGIVGANAFSFFSLPDSIVKTIGQFDETFVNYYSDNDYYRRMLLSSLNIYSVPDCNVTHVGSQTLQRFTETETSAHHQLFGKNSTDYERKWGGMPHQETFTTPYNR